MSDLSRDIQNTFRFIDSILKKKNLALIEPYEATLDTDFGDEGIRLSCHSQKQELENLYFDRNVRIDISKPVDIFINNCIFEKSLSININIPDPLKNLKISIFRSIIGNNFNCDTASYDSISVDSCAINKMFIGNSNVNRIDLFRSELLDIGFEGSDIDILDISNSFIDLIRIYYAKFSSVNIDMESILRYHKEFNPTTINKNC